MAKVKVVTYEKSAADKKADKGMKEGGAKDMRSDRNALAAMAKGKK